MEEEQDEEDDDEADYDEDGEEDGELWRPLSICVTNITLLQTDRPPS